MSITKNALSAAHLSLLDDGTVALTDMTKSGSLRVLRTLSSQELINIVYMVYIDHTTKHPDQPVVYIPLDAGHALAMTVVLTHAAPSALPED